MKLFKIILFLKVSILFALTPAVYAQDVVSTRIWDEAPHNAFTSLIRFESYFYCAFREGQNHVPKDTSQNGKIRIIKSKDGKKWTSAALLKNREYDLRDPKLSLTPDGKMMIIMGGSHYVKGRLVNMKPHVSFSEDGESFSEPQPVDIENGIRTRYDWIWRTTWHKGIGYAILYQSRLPGNNNMIRLVTTTDGLAYYQLKEFDIDSLPNEATIRFDSDEKMMILLRRESGAEGMLGTSEFPYSEWKWTSLGYRLGGPDFLVTGNSRLIIGTRRYNPEGASTIICLTEKDGTIIKTVELPSGGDTSYPGLLIFRNKLWISYYSGHEGKTSIYLATIRLNNF